MQMHLVLTPTESVRFLRFTHAAVRYTLHVNRCVSIASQRVVAAFCGHRNGCLKERVTNLEFCGSSMERLLVGPNPELCKNMGRNHEKRTDLKLVSPILFIISMMSLDVCWFTSSSQMVLHFFMICEC